MSASEQTSASSKEWLERAFEAGANHFAYHESNRSEYSPDFPEWYDWYKDHFEGQPDELSKAQERIRQLEDALVIAWHENPVPGSDKYNFVINALRS